MSLDALRDWLAKMPPGPIPRTRRKELIPLLADCWGELRGGDQEKMHAGKLDRMERAVWEPPALSFIIERHGGTVLGSTQADLQRWTVHADQGTATVYEAGRRQLEPMKPRLDVRPIAQEITQLILTAQQDPRLDRKPDGSVHVILGRIIPGDSGYRWTVEGRQKRFKRSLDELLGQKGWSRGHGDVCQRAPK
jgi:hypothetical protein